MTSLGVAPPAPALERYASLLLDVGVGLQPGQVLAIGAHLEHSSLVHEIARQAYDRGAQHVDALYTDVVVQHAAASRARESSLGWTPPWLITRLETLAELGAARIAIIGDPEPALFADVDPGRLASSAMRPLAQKYAEVSGERALSATVAAFPTPGWANVVYGSPDTSRLWAAMEDALRLNDADPSGAWTTHLDGLDARATALNELGLTHIRFVAPGTDLVIGLVPRVRWVAARRTTRHGQVHVPNLPTEEVFTPPDAGNASGHVRLSRPTWINGRLVEDLVLEFADGRVTDVSGAGAAALGPLLDRDDGSRRLGEVAIVDQSSRIAQQRLTYFETLFDENASCHIALGDGRRLGVPGSDATDKINHSAVHLDLMIGSDDLSVFGVTASGSEAQIVRDNVWVLP